MRVLHRSGGEFAFSHKSSGDSGSAPSCESSGSSDPPTPARARFNQSSGVFALSHKSSGGSGGGALRPAAT